MEHKWGPVIKYQLWKDIGFALNDFEKAEFHLIIVLYLRIALGKLMS